MSDSRPTLDQRRAQHAWQAVEQARKLGPNAKKDFAREAKRLPVRIKTAGLGQALAFLKRQGEIRQGQRRGRPWPTAGCSRGLAPEGASAGVPTEWCHRSRLPDPSHYQRQRWPAAPRHRGGPALSAMADPVQ